MIPLWCLPVACSLSPPRLSDTENLVCMARRPTAHNWRDTKLGTSWNISARVSDQATVPTPGLDTTLGLGPTK